MIKKQLSIRSLARIAVLGFLYCISLSTPLFAAVTYNFNSDTLGQTPSNVNVTAGTFTVVNDDILGQSIKASTQTGVIAGLIFNQFATSTDYSVTWKQSYGTNLGRGGFTLRAQGVDTNVANSAGAKQGYLFQVYDSSAVYIWKVGASSYTSLWNGTLSKAEPRWFKATVQGTTLSFYYSNDGETYTLLGSATDSTYTSGMVQYTAGYGATVNNDVIDDVVITPAIDITGSNTLQGTVNVAVPVTGVQIVGATTTVPVKLLVTSGTLAMSTTTGITFDGASSGSTIYFSGSPTDVNNALASLTYTKTSVGSDTLEISLVSQGEVFFSGTGHLYEYVSSTLTWGNAKTAAEARSKYGAAGYLATITSQEENDFVAARLANAGWMGASDSVSEGVWRWVVGPENGTQFWSGNIGGTTVGGNYANWNGSEPNDSGSNEDCGQFLSGASGRWNDLPCSGTTLPGYVVEYGTTGSLPTVTAKNIAITISAAPTINSLSPADNSTGVTTNANLVITFNKNVSTSTGNIVIRKVADNTIVESVPVSGLLVSGGGTNTITINPVSNLEESTGYYITIPGTAFKDNADVFYTGISASTTWNFTTGDFTAPNISSVSSNVATTTSTVTWTTNELASTQVSFGPSLLYGSSTILADTSPRVTSHSALLTSLMACTQYYYRVISTDASSNTSTSTSDTFTTRGCSGNVIPQLATSTTVAVSSVSTSTLSQGSTTLSVITPSNFTATSSSVVIQIQSLAGTTTIQTIGTPSLVWRAVGDVVFDVKAIIDSHTVLDSFDAPVTIRYQYTDTDIVGLDESTLRLYHYHNNTWLGLDSCSVNIAQNIITCSTPNFSIFSLFGQNAAPTSTTGGGIPYGCTDATSLNYNPYTIHKADMCMYASVSVSETSKIQESSSLAIVPVPTLPVITETSKRFQFTKNLRPGMNHNEVKELQVFLNAQGFRIATTGAGSPGKETTHFGQKTKAALIAFQETHAEIVLKPQDLAKGTGLFLSYTKNLANTLVR